MREAIKRGIVVGIGLTIQIIITLILYLFLIDKLLIIYLLFSLLQIIIIVNLIKNSKNYAITLPLIIILLFFPLIGTLLFIIIVQNKYHSKLLKSIVTTEKETKKYLEQDKIIKEEIKNHSNLKYISDFAGFPVTKNNEVFYYPLGEIAFKEMLSELKKAKKFIFIEYFIINNGVMWNSILEILKTKVKEKVEVRVIYDDAGCIATLKKHYNKELEKIGIKCLVFNKLNPVSSNNE